MTPKEFYFWLRGFLTNLEWESFSEGHYEIMKETLSKVRNDDEKSDFLSKFLEKRECITKQTLFPDGIPIKPNDDDLGSN